MEYEFGPEDEEREDTDDEELEDDNDAEDLQDYLKGVTGKETPAKQEPAKETPTKEEPKQEPVKEEPKVEPAAEPAKEPDKPASKTYSEDEYQQALEKARREASEQAARAVTAKERARDDSARKQMKDLEHVFGIPYEQIVAAGRTNRINQLVDDGHDEATAKRIVQTEEENARLKAEERQRQQEHTVVTMKENYRGERERYLNDAALHPEVKSVIKDHIKDVDEFAFSAIEDGREMPFEVALDYQLGRLLRSKLPEILSQREKVVEQRTLANIQQRGKATPESAATSGREEDALPRLSTDQKEMAYAAMPHLSKAEAERRFADRLRKMAKH